MKLALALASLALALWFVLDREGEPDGAGAGPRSGDGSASTLAATERLEEAEVPVSRAPIASAVDNLVASAPEAGDDAPVMVDVDGTLALVDLARRPLVGFRLRETSGPLVQWQGGDPVWVNGGTETQRISLADQRRLREDPGFAEEFASARKAPEEWRSWLFGTPLPELEELSGEGGRLPFDLDAMLEGVKLVDPGWTLVGLATDREGAAARYAVAAPSVQLAGVVTDMDGAPLHRVRVRLAPDSVEAVERASAGLELSRSIAPPEIYSMPDGGFALRDVPSVPGVEFELSVDGYRALVLPVPAVDHYELSVQLEPDDTQPLTFEGQVLAAATGPIEGATVFLGSERATTDADGRFSFVVSDIEDDATLAVVAARWEPLIEEDFGARLKRDPGNESVRNLFLQQESRTLRGRVVDAAGRPLDGVSLNLFDPNLPDTGFSTLERMSGDRERQVSTDASGEFALSGLASQSYRLRIFDAERSLLHVTGPVAAGVGYVEIDVPETARRAVAGYVVDREGERVEGARVAVVLPTFVARGGGSLTESCAPTVTDSKGRFELASVPTEHALIEIEVGDARAAVPVEFADGDELVLSLSPRRAISIAAPRAQEGDQIVGRDGAGRAVRFAAWGADPSAEDLGTSLPARARVEVSVAASTAELLLVRDGRIADRVALPDLGGRVSRVTLGGD